ncbi:MAG TPA: metallophosphoesterase [Mycobacteriales bacterium]|nr:metallophosphoesterase [Mycobacteriales bacterium]
MRILHISDLHVETEPERAYPGVNASLARDAEILRRTAADLMIVSGDLTTHGSAEPEPLRRAREWVQSIGIPYLAIPGNHDLGPEKERGLKNPEQEAYDDRPYGQTNFGRIFGPDPLVRHETDQLRVLGVGLREEDPDGALDALEEALADDIRPVLLFGHYPVVTVRDHGTLARFGADTFITTTVRRLHDIIRRHPRIVLYVCGHIHVVSAVPIAPHCLQLTAGALGPGASSYRIYEVDGAGIQFTSLLGSGPLNFWERHGDPDVPREYSLGSPEERQGYVRFA